MFNPNILLPGMGGDLDIDMSKSAEQYFIETRQELRNIEEKAEQAIHDLYHNDALYFHAFFAVALTQRARKKMAQLEADWPEYFQRKAETRRVKIYNARYATGNPAVDDCLTALLTLYAEEVRREEAPEKSLAVVRSAYPKIYNMCKAAGNATDIGVLFLRLVDVDLAGDVSVLSSEGLLVFCLIYWLFVALDKELTPYDAFFALCVHNSLQDHRDLDDLPEPGPEEKRRARELGTALTGKTIPCTQALQNPLISKELLQRYHYLLEISGRALDIRKILEQTPLTDRELRRLLVAERESGTELPELLVPFLLIKSSLLLADTFHKELSQALTELGTLRKLAAEEKPVDEQVAAQAAEIARLEGELRQAQGNLKTATGNERALAAEVSNLNKKLELRDEEARSHHHDLRELAELREALYHLMTQQEAPEEEDGVGDITYPYIDLPDGILCFGGYDGWRNKMQERFPTVRFVPVDYRYDSGVLRRAPCIWIHPGYISHKMYNRIISDARIAGIDAHYFRSHGVDSSSKLMVETMLNK